MTHDKIPIIFVEFPDLLAHFKDENNKPTPELKNILFSDIKPSLKTYYQEMSYDTFIPDGIYLGWYMMPQTYEWYSAEGADKEARLRQLNKDAANLARNDIPDSLDVNNDGIINTAVVIYAGPNRVIYNDIWQNIRATCSQFGFGSERIYTATGKEIIKSTAIQELDYSSFVYGNYTPALYTLLHEFTHCLGVDEIYDGGNELPRINGWSMMANDIVGLDAYSKYILGWLTPRVNPIGTDIQLKTSSKYNDSIIYSNPDFANQYFLIENRQKAGYDTGLIGTGILIYRIDFDPEVMSKLCQYVEGKNEIGQKKQMILADNRNAIPMGYENGRGSAADPFPGTTNNRAFGENTSPSARFCSGWMGLEIKNISDSSEIMTFDANFLSTVCPICDIIIYDSLECTKILIDDIDCPQTLPYGYHTLSTNATGGASPLSYTWNIGSGSITNIIPSLYTMILKGTWDISVTVTDNYNNTCSSNICSITFI